MRVILGRVWGALIRPCAVTPAVMHARDFGGAPPAREMVIASLVAGARARGPDVVPALRG
jgi:hypothetical protein